MDWGVFGILIMTYVASLLFMLLIQRPVFIIYNRKSWPKEATAKDLWQIYRHGILSDFIVSAYLTALPLLALWLFFDLHFSGIYTVLCVITGLLAVFVTLVSLGDTALYDFWHFKMDSSVLWFLKSPKDAVASVSGLYLAVAAVAIVAFWSLYYFFMTSLFRWGLTWVAADVNVYGYIIGNLLFILAVGVLFLIIRGLRIRPNNPTIVLFSKLQFLNHAALNSIFNFVYSISHSDPYSGVFHYYDDSVAEKTVSELYPRNGNTKVEILKNKRPNILFIVWESLSAQFAGFTGGDPQVTPSLDRLAAEGVAFTNCDCGSFLTDRGLVCIFSGLPGQPTATIVKETKKLPSLPSFPRKLKTEGYETLVIHGGDLSVRQKADYYLASGHDRLVAYKNFTRSSKTCKWGVHDEVTFDYLFDDIMEKHKSGKRWMTTLQTLSSHEPFIVPYNRLDDKMKNAFAYTDEALGRFIDRLKKTETWDNLMVVITGDHGVHYGTEYGTALPPQEYPHIPAVIVGGAVNGPLVVDTLMSQTDLAATILGQMGIGHDEFVFSRDVFADSYVEPFTFHSDHHSIVVRDNEGSTVINTDSGEATYGDDPAREAKAKSILQYLYFYISKL